MNEKNIKLPLIPEPEEDTRTILTNKTPPIIKGGGGPNYICGKCGAVLMEEINSPYRNIVLLCPKCGSYNEVNI